MIEITVIIDSTKYINLFEVSLGLGDMKNMKGMLS